MSGKNDKSPDAFWQEYEEKTGEKVLKRGLGKYISGWDEFDEKKQGGLWGLVITTSGGFRFHHFPQYTWVDAFTGFAKGEPPKEKTIFIPKERVNSQEIIMETRWWKAFFTSSPPRIIINYIDEKGGDKRLVFEAEYKK